MLHSQPTFKNTWTNVHFFLSIREVRSYAACKNLPYLLGKPFKSSTIMLLYTRWFVCCKCSYWKLINDQIFHMYIRFLVVFSPIKFFWSKIKSSQKLAPNLKQQQSLTIFNRPWWWEEWWCRTCVRGHHKCHSLYIYQSDMHQLNSTRVL